MSVWLKCKNCKEEFYTDSNTYKIDHDKKCNECGGNLNKMQKDIEEILKSDMLVEVKIDSGRDDLRTRCMVKNIEDDSIKLIVIDGQIPRGISLFEKVEVSFSRDKPKAGRYQFHSSIKQVSTEEGNSVVIISVPEYALRHQERGAPRFPLDAEVKYRLVDSKADFDEIKSGGEYEEPEGEKVLSSEGKAVDVSLSGILVADDPGHISDVEENQRVSLNIETENEKIELSGKIARVTDLDEEEKLGLGIKFEDISGKEELLLQKMQMESL